MLTVEFVTYRPCNFHGTRITLSLADLTKTIVLTCTTRFNTPKLYILPTERKDEFRVVLNRRRILP
jgi:hypothetical protein